MPSMSLVSALSAVLLFSSSLHVNGWQSVTSVVSSFEGPKRHGFTPQLYASPPGNVQKPFGKQEYWEGWYQNRSLASNDSTQQSSSGDFSWYSGWSDIAPLVSDFGIEATNSSILLPGIGMDAALVVDMITEGGFTNIWAMDYAPAAVDYVHQRLQQAQESSSEPSTASQRITNAHVDVQVADLRELPYPSNTFDVVLDKGTLDSVFLCGSTPTERLDNLHRGVKELQRCIKPGGILWSLSGICVQEVQTAEWWDGSEWRVLCNTDRDGLYMTDDGYTSNNLDGALLVWQKRTA